MNKPKESEEHVSGSVSGSISGSPNTSSLTTELINNASSPSSDGVGPSNSPIGEALETEGAEKVD